MQNLQVELRFAFQRYEPHGRPGGRLGDRFSVPLIRLLRLTYQSVI
jgi:hypothetical protein